jgi:hypothetical protein
LTGAASAVSTFFATGSLLATDSLLITRFTGALRSTA